MWPPSLQSSNSRSESVEFQVSVVGRAQLSPVPSQLCPWTHFIILHRLYVEPRYVLKRDNVTLQGITKTHAFFCVSSKGEDVQDIKGKDGLAGTDCNARFYLFLRK